MNSWRYSWSSETRKNRCSRSVLRWVARPDAVGVLDLAGFEVAAAALVALVAARRRTAVRAGALDVAVGQGVVLDGVPGDLDLLLVDVPLLVERADDVAGEFRVRLVVRVAVVVELDVELRERRLVLFVVPERELPGRDALLLGVDGHRGTVHVRPGDERRLLAELSQRARRDVAADVRPQVTDVQVPVGVGEPAGHHRGVVGRILVVAHAINSFVAGVKPAGFGVSRIVGVR